MSDIVKLPFCQHSSSFKNKTSRMLNRKDNFISVIFKSNNSGNAI